MSEVASGKKSAPAIDMTPMVDLAFLLIAFFMLATTLAKPKAMEILKPAKKEKEDKNDPVVNKGRVMSILLGENDKIYYYQISDEDLAKGNLKVDSTDFSAKGVRGAIRFRQDAVAADPRFGNKDSLIVLIKGAPKAKYKNMVDILDEMRISKVKSYALVDRDKVDTAIMENMGLLKK